MFPQISVGTRKKFVIDLADFSTQTEKGCPPCPTITFIVVTTFVVVPISLSNTQLYGKAIFFRSWMEFF